jgi:hypothetical protein
MSPQDKEWFRKLRGLQWRRSDGGSRFQPFTHQAREDV